ncbi:MAG: phage tail protein [Rhizobiales bacterium]|nr:phage tail protein [Hyphomicrobiales bacterium]
MAFASGSEVRRAYVAESAWGTTPTTPVFKVLRTTGGNIRNNKTTKKSNEIQADRNVRDEFMTALGASGSYNFELSYASFDDIFESVLAGTWATDVLKNGATRKYFTFEETLASAIVSGATYTAPNDNEIMVAGVSVGGLAVAGLSPVPKLRKVTLNIEQNIRKRPTINSLYTEEFGWGFLDVTGTFEAYFESGALYQEVLDHGGGALSLTLGQTTAEKYTIDLPAVRFLDGERQVGGNEDDVMVSVPFRARYDGTETASIKITRAVA